MNQRSFLARGEAQWTQLERLLGLAPVRVRLHRRRGHRPPPAADATPAGGAAPATGPGGVLLPDLFRRVCRDLALARHRGYALPITERLNHIAVEAHARLYTPAGVPWGRIAAFFGRDFPRAVRAEWRLLLLNALLFYGSAIATFQLVTARPELVYSVLDPATVAGLEAMYEAGGGIDEERSLADDLLMFGGYVLNNVSIDFCAFAGGLMFALGALFYLLFNGVFLGVVFAHLTNAGSGEQLASFVAGHGALELTALVLAGVAGMRLGLALLAPGRRTRGDALRHAAKHAIPVLLGAAAMTTVAAVIEAFWSPRVLPQSTKYAFGAVVAALLLAYLLLAGLGGGRRR